jgi:hypothetical protein
MSRKQSEFNRIIAVLNEIHRNQPKCNIGKHIATALDGSDLWGMSDKILLEYLTKYKEEQDIDGSHTNEKELDAIINGGMNLDNLFEEEYNGEDY